jgi:hypothetical protein
MINTTKSIFGIPSTTTEAVLTPPVPVKPKSRNVWPELNMTQMSAFYGYHRAEYLTPDGVPSPRWESSFLTNLELPFSMRLSWNKEVYIRTIRVNDNISKSLSNIFFGLFELYGNDVKKIRHVGMDLYAGCYRFNLDLGGDQLSPFAWGAAISINPEGNPFGQKWKANSGMMPTGVVDLFESENWEWLGRRKTNPQCSVFQACKSK